ncbi:MAG: DNA recombination protein RmuC [Deltaproteobacteria bacterium]|nr:DNA recombination protein RmuC [Deltaproteobacteria bacterium]
MVAFICGLTLGILLVYLYFRSKFLSLQTALRISEQAQEERTQLLRQMEFKLQDALDGKARAEQDAKRIPELEEELRSLRIENTNLRTEIAEVRKLNEVQKEKIQWVDEAQRQLKESFQALASQVLQINAQEFLKQAKTQLEGILSQMRSDLHIHKAEFKGLIEPIEGTLKALDTQIRELEQKREGAYQGIKEQLYQLAQTHYQLHETTVDLLRALKSPPIRGRWGEYQLRRVVEMAGMLEHVDFEEQDGIERGRPDMIIFLPNGGFLPVDAKTPMQAYLEAVEARDDQTRAMKLAEHAKSVKERIKQLGQRQYWQQLGRTPEFVIMFVPNDASLSAAFEREPELFDFAIQHRVFPATPLSLLALLRACAYGWQQHKVAENALQVAKQGRELYERFSKFVEHIGKIGVSLNNAIKSYNEALGSLESRLLPTAKRFRELCGLNTEIEPPEAIDRQAKLPFGGMQSLE